MTVFDASVSKIIYATADLTGFIREYEWSLKNPPLDARVLSS